MHHAPKNICLGGLLFVAELLYNPWPRSFTLSTPFTMACLCHMSRLLASLSTIKDFRVQQSQHLLSGGRTWASESLLFQTDDRHRAKRVQRPSLTAGSYKHRQSSERASSSHGNSEITPSACFLWTVESSVFLSSLPLFSLVMAGRCKKLCPFCLCPLLT